MAKRARERARLEKQAAKRERRQGGGSQDVTDAVDVLAESLISNMPAIRSELRDVRHFAQKFAYFDVCFTINDTNIFLDLGDLCDEITGRVTAAPEVTAAATALSNAIVTRVIGVTGVASLMRVATSNLGEIWTSAWRPAWPINVKSRSPMPSVWPSRFR